MNRLFRILIQYKIKFLIPFLLSVGVILSSMGILIAIYFIVSTTFEKHLYREMEFHHHLLQQKLNADNISHFDPNQFNQKYDFLMNYKSLKAIFIIDLKNEKIIMSNSILYANKKLKTLKPLDPYYFIWELLYKKYYPHRPLNANELQTKIWDKLYKKVNKENFFQYKNYFIHFHDIDQNQYILIVLYQYNLKELFNLQSIIILTGIVLIIIFFPFLLFIYIYKNFYQNRIETLLKGIQNLSEGKLAIHIPVTGKDEISLLISFVNSMAEKLQKLVFEDSLTQVLNRKGYEYFVTKQLKSIEKGCIFFMDLDGFKYINETFGHKVGDKALQAVTKRLSGLTQQNLLGTSIILGRIGGDEFSLFFRVDHLKEAYLDIQIFALKIIEEISKEFFIDELSFHLGVSIGIVLYPEHGKNLNELLTNADLAMYQSKYTTKNNYNFFDDKIKSAFERKNSLRNVLIQIFRKNKFSENFYLVYQPIFNLQTQTITHLEVLLRFYHPEIKASPKDFIPLLEELNFIEEMGYYVIERAILEFLEIQHIFSNPIKLSINLSVFQLIQKKFYKTVYHIFKSYSIEPQSIIFEITETQFMQYPEKVLRVMNTLHDDGYLFALDDFGTGYSSLSYLKLLPLDYLKIDKSFLSDIITNTKSELILKSIFNLAHLLNLTSIAEGVEDVSTLKKVQELGCIHIQGFFISHPKSKEDLKKFLSLKDSLKIDF